MKAFKLLVAVALLAAAACQSQSPMGLSDDHGTLQTAGGTCDPQASPC